MQPDDPFPLEEFSGPAKASILNQFGGRQPSIREVASIPAARWLTLPGFGPATLEKLQLALEGKLKTLNGLFALTDAALQSEHDRVQQELSRHKSELGQLQHRLRAIRTEMLRRGLSSGQRDESSE